MEDIFFVSYTQTGVRIPALEALPSLMILGIIVFLAILISTKQKHGNIIDPVSIEATQQLRGIAILFLIYDHFTRMCIEGEIITRNAGNWAVVIFLTISGIGLVKTHGLDRFRKGFLIKRVKRLLVPTWITFSLFYLLEYIILGNTYPISKILLNYLGIIGPHGPNGPAWFISYILVLYILYYLVAWLNINKKAKIILLFLPLMLTTIFITYTPNVRTFMGIWKQYTIVFPLAVISGLFREKIFIIYKNKFKYSKLYSMALIALLGSLYSLQSMLISRLSYLESPFKTELITIINMLLPIYLVIIIMTGLYLLDSGKYRFRVLSFVGKYSFEIYLIHYPFMVDYNFFFNRKPLYLSFFVYGGFILGLSYLLKKSVESINQELF